MCRGTAAECRSWCSEQRNHRGLKTPTEAAIGSRLEQGRGAAASAEAVNDRWEAAKPSSCLMASILCVPPRRWLGFHHPFLTTRLASMTEPTQSSKAGVLERSSLRGGFAGVPALALVRNAPPPADPADRAERSFVLPPLLYELLQANCAPWKWLLANDTLLAATALAWLRIGWSAN